MSINPAHAMCSHENITWEITDNFAADKMIDNSLVHKFKSLRKIRKRTKVLNEEIKKYSGVKDYKHYVKLKTNVLRHLVNDSDISDSCSSLTDIDGNTVHNSVPDQAKYVTKKFESYILSSEEDSEGYKRRTVENQMKSKHKRKTKKRIQTRKSSRIKYATGLEAHVNVSWQKVKKSSKTLHLHKQVCTDILDNEGNMKSSNHNFFKAQSNKQSFFPSIDFSNSTESTSNGTISNKTKPSSEKKISKRNHESQSIVTDESNTEINSHCSRQSSLSQIGNDSNFNNKSTEAIVLAKSKNDELTTSNKSNTISTNNSDNTYVNDNSELLKNVKKNLISALEKADSTNNNIKTDKNVENIINYDQFLADTVGVTQYCSTPIKKMKTNMSEKKKLSSDISCLDQQKDSGIDEDSQDKFVKIKDSNKIATNYNMKENPKSTSIFSPELGKNDDIIETVEDYKEDEENEYITFGKDILKEQIEEVNKVSVEEEIINSSQLKDTHLKPCDIFDENQQILPKIMWTEVLNKKYKIIKMEDNDIENNINNSNVDIADKCTPTKKNVLVNDTLDVTGHNIHIERETAVTTEEIDIPMALETDNEELNVNYVSPQTKKRLEQQARLNLIVNSDSSDSDFEYETTKTSQKLTNSSNTNHCSNDIELKQIDVSRDKEIFSQSEEATLVSIDVVESNSPSTMEDMKNNTESLTKCMCENKDLSQFRTNKNLFKKTEYYTQVYSDDQSNDDIFNDSIFTTKNNISCNNEESINQFRKYEQSASLNKKDKYIADNRNKEITNAYETKHTSEHDQNTQAPTKSHSNPHLTTSCQYRPCNLQELVEDQELLVETMPPSFTLSNLSEDEEAFILNVPSKVVQGILEGQVLRLNDKSIRFNEDKYRIVHREVGTTSCVFATGKKRKPYKILNIKNISTLTVREKLSEDSRKIDMSNSYDVSILPKLIKKNKKQTGEADSKILKVLNCKKRKRRES
ncbi:hypothetical protein PUN28_006071 [Cardiocondyla obscurior]